MIISNSGKTQIHFVLQDKKVQKLSFLASGKKNEKPSLRLNIANVSEIFIKTWYLNCRAIGSWLFAFNHVTEKHNQEPSAKAADKSNDHWGRGVWVILFNSVFTLVVIFPTQKDKRKLWIKWSISLRIWAMLFKKGVCSAHAFIIFRLAFIPIVQQIFLFAILLKIRSNTDNSYHYVQEICNLPFSIASFFILLRW